MQLSLHTEEGPRATDGLKKHTKVTETLEKPRRGTQARLLAELQRIPNLDVQATSREDGATVVRHVPPRGAGGWRRALDLPACPSAAAAQLHSNGRMERWTLNPHPAKTPCRGLGTLQRVVATRDRPVKVCM